VVWPQNHSDGFHRFGLKISGDSFLQFGLKTGGDGFSWFGLKTGGRFLGSVSKPRWWRVSRFGPQNHRDGFLVWALKPSGLRFVGCATKPIERGRRGTCVEI
jgi:hypothetical protein